MQNNQAEQRVKQYITTLQKNKVEIVSSRKTPDEVVDWLRSSLPEQFHTVATIGVIMMQNTMIDLVTAHLNELAIPPRDERVSS